MCFLEWVGDFRPRLCVRWAHEGDRANEKRESRPTWFNPDLHSYATYDAEAEDYEG